MDELDAGSRVVLTSIPENSPTVVRHRNVRKPRSLVQIGTPKSIALNTSRRTRSHSFGEESYATFEKTAILSNEEFYHEDLEFWEGLRMKVKVWILDLVAGFIAFLLSSTIAVSCATVVVGHGTILTPHVSNIIDLNIIGTAVLCIVLAWKSTAPWTLGAVDVFVAPILAEIARSICIVLSHDPETVVPTVIVMVITTAVFLGVALYLMGLYGISSIANYMPFPVIAGFLAGVGAKLVLNGIHMAANTLNIYHITIHDVVRVAPAIAFAVVNRLSQSRRWNVIITFPLLLSISIAGFYVGMHLSGMTFEEAKHGGWLFNWPSQVIDDTPRWYAWSRIDFHKVQFHAIFEHNLYLYCTLLLLGALKYSVFVGSFSTVFGRDINPDTEMQVIGIANAIAGIFGGNSGCHYLSAMGMLQKLGSREKAPAVICAIMYIILWFVGFKPLQYCPKFVFGGLLLNIGLHFLQGYLIAPAFIMTKSETGVLVSILILFLCVGMLQSVAFGIIVSLFLLVYRIHSVGCIRNESTGVFTRSTVDRSNGANNYLDAHGHSIHILMLQGYVFFGTSVSILERVNARLRCLDLPRLECLIVDFALVPSFDATALNNFSKLTEYASRNRFTVYLSGMRPSIKEALHRTVSTQSVIFAPDVDHALELSEDFILPPETRPRIMRGIKKVMQRTDVVEAWESYLLIQTFQTASRLIPLAIYLDWKVVQKGEIIASKTPVEVYFIVEGYVEIVTTRESVGGLQVNATGSIDPGSIEHGSPRRMEALMKTEAVRLRKAGIGSIFGYKNADDTANARRDHIAGSTCGLLMLKREAMETLESVSPTLACELMKFINSKLSGRSKQSNKQISQLSRLLYSDRHDSLLFSYK